MSVCGGGGLTRIFWGSQRGGPVFFQWVKGGDQNFLSVTEGGAEFAHAEGGTRIFLRMPRGGPEKIGNQRSQTDGPPSR